MKLLYRRVYARDPSNAELVSALAYVSNFIPRMRWGMALVPRTGEARLLCSMGTRDLPAMRTMTWIADVQSGWGPEWPKAFDPWIERLKAEQPVRLGFGRSCLATR